MGSDSDGEALNAARKACAILKEHKLTWEDVIHLEEVKVTPAFVEAAEADWPPFHEQASSPNHVDMATWLTNNAATAMTSRERSFVADMLEWRYPSPKQIKWLKMIYKEKGGK